MKNKVIGIIGTSVLAATLLTPTGVSKTLQDVKVAHAQEKTPYLDIVNGITNQYKKGEIEKYKVYSEKKKKMTFVIGLVGVKNLEDTKKAIKVELKDSKGKVVSKTEYTEYQGVPIINVTANLSFGEYTLNLVYGDNSDVTNLNLVTFSDMYPENNKISSFKLENKGVLRVGDTLKFKLNTTHKNVLTKYSIRNVTGSTYVTKTIKGFSNSKELTYKVTKKDKYVVTAEVWDANNKRTLKTVPLDIKERILKMSNISATIKSGKKATIGVSNSIKGNTYSLGYVYKNKPYMTKYGTKTKIDKLFKSKGTYTIIIKEKDNKTGKIKTTKKKIKVV